MPITKLPVPAGEMLLTEEACGYEAVLDEAERVGSIFVLTYSPLEGRPQLLNRLRASARIKTATIVSNIPAWGYRGGHPAKRKDEIRSHLALLDFSALAGKEFSTYFHMNSHAKIVSAGALTYVGSSNFTTASTRKLECGVLIDDKKASDSIRSTVWEQIRKRLYRYVGPDDLLMPALETVSTAQFAIEEEVEALLKDIWDDRNGPSVHREVLHRREAAMSNLASELYEPLSWWGSDDAALRAATDVMRKETLERCRDLLENDDLNRLAGYDPTRVQDDLLEDATASDPDEERLGSHQIDAAQHADEAWDDLFYKCEDSLKELLILANDLPDELAKGQAKLEELAEQHRLITE